MSAVTSRTVILGDEYDNALRKALKESLVSLGAVASASDWGVGGSQEMERVEVLLRGKVLVIEAETYVGLTLTGDVELTTLVEALVKEKLSHKPPR